MKILVPVSIDSFREDAACLAIDTSRALRAEIRLLSVVDREGIRRAESGAPPGAIHIAQMAEKEIAERQGEERVVSGTKVETFLAFCQEEGADAVVLGGWGKRRWNEFFGSSITGRLLDLKRFHMFLYM